MNPTVGSSVSAGSQPHGGNRYGPDATRYETKDRHERPPLHTIIMQGGCLKSSHETTRRMKLQEESGKDNETLDLAMSPRFHISYYGNRVCATWKL